MNPRSSRKTAPLRSRQRAAASDAILDAAEAVAVERGLESASCAAIAERAGVAVGTLYNYFPDREGLLTALFKERRAELGPRIAAAAEAAAALAFEPRLRSFVGAVLATYEAHRGFIRLAIEADRAMPKVKDPRMTLMVQLTAALEDIFRDGAAAGALPAGRHEVYARMLLGQMKAVVVWRIAGHQPVDTDAELVVDTFLHGVVAPRAGRHR